MADLVLASASPRRRELLAELGVSFEVIPARIPERPAAGERAERFARRIARAKVAAVAGRAAGRFVLGADTIVVVDGEILGKPVSRDAATAMLRRLAGRIHLVETAVVLRAPDGSLPLDDLIVTTVEFRRLDDDEIRAYVDTGEADDKAGAYAIQGRAAAFVHRTDGSYTNVVGLPLETVRPALCRAGLWDGRAGGSPAT